MIDYTKIDAVVEAREELFLELDLSDEQEQKLRDMMACGAAATASVFLGAVKSELEGALNALDGLLEASEEQFRELS